MANPTLKLKNAQQKLLTIANVNLKFQVYTEFSTTTTSNDDSG